VSWWPWAQTGPNAVFPTTFRSMADYRHLDRTMRSGELARLDVGCEYDHYHSDVGRTVPVSGEWTPGQAEAWDLLVAGYRAGLRVIRDGVSIDSVRAAFDAAVRAAQPRLQTGLGREAARILLDHARTRFWQIHGVGLDAAEPTGPVLRRGMVVAYEPMFTVQSFGFYLEDLLLVTETGYEMLTPGLPYTSGEIARAVAR
jgi:Xaa-Pro aminopeptidase